MKTQKHLENWIPLYLYDELNIEEKKAFERHIQSCEQCSTLFDQTKALHGIIDQRISKEPSDFLVAQSRQRLLDALKDRRRPVFTPSWITQLIEFVSSFRPGFKFAGAVALLFLGILIGRFTYSGPMAGPVMGLPGMQRAPFISNVDMIQYNPASGEVTVRYKTVRDISLHGNIDDADIRKVLVHAIRSDDHPGRRLTAVKASSAGEFSDEELEDALIHAMENDEVDGVRLKAARVLKGLSINQKLKRAFIRVLINEMNSAIRIVALEALDSLTDQADIFPIFRDAAKDDENEFVRLQAGRALERLHSSKNNIETQN